VVDGMTEQVIIDEHLRSAQDRIGVKSTECVASPSTPHQVVDRLFVKIGASSTGDDSDLSDHQVGTSK
jgi:hypothetical protein